MPERTARVFAERESMLDCLAPAGPDAAQPHRWARIGRIVAAVVAGLCWLFVVYAQAGLVFSRLLPTNSSGPWPLANVVFGMVLVCLPVGLAAVAFWIGRRYPIAFGLLVHLLGMVAAFCFWLL